MGPGSVPVYLLSSPVLSPCCYWFFLRGVERGGSVAYVSEATPYSPSYNTSFYIIQYKTTVPPIRSTLCASLGTSDRLYPKYCIFAAQLLIFPAFIYTTAPNQDIPMQSPTASVGRLRSVLLPIVLNENKFK